MDEYVQGSVCDTIKTNGKKKKVNTKLSNLFSENFKLPVINKKTVEKEKEVIKDVKEKIKLSEENIKEQSDRTVFVGNLSIEVNKKMIKQLFQPFGNVESIRLRSAAPSNPKLPKKAIVIKKLYNEKKNTLNAYVVFKLMESAVKSCSLNGKEFQGYHLRVDSNLVKKEVEDFSLKLNLFVSLHPQHNHKKSVFVGNLAFDVKEESLRSIFEVAGVIENIRVIRDKFTGIGKGFGYILFKEESAVSLALKLNGKKVGLREIRVQISTSKPKEKTTIKRKHEKSKDEVIIKKKFMGDINTKEFKKSRDKTRENRKKFKKTKTSFGVTKSKRIKKSKKSKKQSQ